MQLFSADATIFKKEMKKLPSKILHNQFSVLPTGPKPAQISNSIP
jgi:hypothetical protein